MYKSIRNKKITKNINDKNDNNKSIFQKQYIIFLLNSSSRILSGIYKIEICESFSFMIVMDKMNKVYLYNFNSFNIIKYIDFSSTFNLKLKYISICPYTGDFIVATKRNVVLMNINGVFLSQTSDIKSNINSHVICQDICTIIKGCVFEWCLSGEKFDIETTIHRIIKTYLEKFLR